MAMYLVLPDKVKHQNQEVLEYNGLDRMEDPLVLVAPVLESLH